MQLIYPKLLFSKSLFLAIPLILSTLINYSQEKYVGLVSLKTPYLSCYYSEGQKDRAIQVASFCSNAMEYYNVLLGFKPEVDLLVLSKSDWSHNTVFPVYGMPHYNDKKTLIVAAEENEFWNSFIPPAGKLPGRIMDRIKKTFGNKDGSITMRAFFDLLALHELGHAYYQQAGIIMQRHWLSEFFSNLFLHTYIAKKQPNQLDALVLFPEMVIASGKDSYKFKSLEELENNYELIAKQYPQNYGWYQSRWHQGARQVYDAAGENVLVHFWLAFKDQKEILRDPVLADFLREKIHPAMALFYQNWDKQYK